MVTSSHAYTCPYNSEFPDIYINFVGCTTNPTPPAVTFAAYPTPAVFLPFSSAYTTGIGWASSSLPFESPIYDLGVLNSGDRLLLDIQVPSAGTNGALLSSLSIQLLRGSRSGSATALESQCSSVTYNCQIDTTVTTSSQYYLSVSDPAGNFISSYVQYFTIHAQKSSSGTVTTIFRYVDVVRNRVVKYIYSNGATAHSFTLSPIEANTNGTNITANTTNRYLTLYRTTGMPA